MSRFQREKIREDFRIEQRIDVKIKRIEENLTQGLANCPRCRTTFVICFVVKSVPIIIDIRQAFDAKTFLNRDDS